MVNLKKRIIGLVIATAIMICGALALAFSLHNTDTDPCPVELIDDLPDRPGRL